MQRLGLICLAIWIVVLATTPFYAGNYVVRTAIMIAMYSVLAYSWNFIGGMTGYPSFSTAAFFGIGAYAGAVAQRNGAPMGLAWALATFVVAVFAAALGSILLRLKGHYFAIGSIAVVEVCRLVVSSWGSLTGGGDGLNLPLLRWRPDQVSVFFLMVMMAILLTVLGLTILVSRSRLGFGLRCIHQNEDAANMVGVDTTAYKVSAYVLSAMFCGTIGAAYASWTGYIDPTESFQILMSLKVPVMVLLGGAGTVLGPAIGTTAFILLEEIFWSNFLDWNRAILGAVIVVVIFFLPGGFLNLPIKRLFAGERLRGGEVAGVSAILEVAGLSKRFGGVSAVEDVSFSLREGEIVGLIGPNGAGKTTLVNLITGVHKPSRGRVIFRGRDVTGRAPMRSARSGVVRTFQIVQPFPAMSVLENVMAGALFGGGASSLEAAADQAREHLDFVGLGAIADKPAAALTLPNRKRLELAKSLAMKPKVLMLDEVNAGLQSSEIDNALDLIRRIAQRGVTILIIEHLMKVVLSVSERLLVLHHGKLIADGKPADIVRDRQVIEAYLGEKFAARLNDFAHHG